MRVSGRINHVSVNARDLQESVDFYVDLLGAQPIPTPNFDYDAFRNHLVELPGDVV
jgi:catechol 2,3-dioxygenase-like lactoylglutathione lyase family enzyme